MTLLAAHRALGGALLVLARRDRPEGAPRTGGIHVDMAEVKRVVNALIASLPHTEDRRIDAKAISGLRRNAAGWTLGFKWIKVVDTREVPHVIYVDILDPKEHSAAGHFHPLPDRTPTKGYGLFGFIGLTVRDLFSTPTIDADFLAKKWRSVLAHELAHARDEASWSSTRGEGTQGLEPGAYFNHPREVKAFLAQMVVELQGDEAFEALAFEDDPDFTWRTAPLDWAERSSPTWEKVKDHLKPANLRRFHKAIADVYADVLDRKRALAS